MIDIEKISAVAMEIITYAGLAKSNYLIALKECKQGRYEEAKVKLEEGSNEFVKAHKCHGKLLTVEMQTLQPQVTLFLVHAEDQLMSAETIKILVEELIEIYKESRGI